jgi:hypothetical protein
MVFFVLVGQDYTLVGWAPMDVLGIKWRQIASLGELHALFIHRHLQFVRFRNQFLHFFLIKQYYYVPFLNWYQYKVFLQPMYLN